MGWRRRATAILLSGVLAGGPAFARQDADDWDFGHDPERKLTIAAVTFENFGVAVRCMDQSLAVVLSGLPVASGERRLSYQIGASPDIPSQWISGRDSSSAFALWPRALAEQLKDGGPFTVTVPDGPTARRYSVTLPESRASIGRVFEACGRSLNSEDDPAPTGEQFAGLRWRTPPEVRHPGEEVTGFGVVALECTVLGNGMLSACTVESEFPEGVGYGRSAQLGAHRTARVESIERGRPIAGRQVVFLTRFAGYRSGVNTTPRRTRDRDPG